MESDQRVDELLHAGYFGGVKLRKGDLHRRWFLSKTQHEHPVADNILSCAQMEERKRETHNSRVVKEFDALGDGRGEDSRHPCRRPTISESRWGIGVDKDVPLNWAFCKETRA